MFIDLFFPLCGSGKESNLQNKTGSLAPIFLFGSRDILDDAIIELDGNSIQRVYYLFGRVQTFILLFVGEVELFGLLPCF